MKLFIAVEQNVGIATMVKNMMMKGFQMGIPYVLSFKNPGSGTSQNINIPLDGRVGITLMKVIHSLYNTTENFDLCYDHANMPISQKVEKYTTQFRSNQIQSMSLTCDSSGPYLDCLYNKTKLKGST